MCLNDVSPIEVLAVVLYAYRTFGNSSGHTPFASSSQTLMIFNSLRFVTSVGLYMSYRRELVLDS